MALKVLGRADVAFVRFPDETHELSRSGKPSRRVERFRMILDWLDRYLNPGMPPPKRSALLRRPGTGFARQGRTSTVMKASRVGLGLAGLVVLLILFASLRGRQDNPAKAGAPSPTQAATPTPEQPSQGLILPTRVIPLPKGCPPQTAPQIDNVNRYGFCTPVGWGAYNNNNSQALTLLMRPRPGGNPSY